MDTMFLLVFVFAIAALALSWMPSLVRAEGASIYAKRCASCHGEDGTASTPVGRALKIPSFVGSTYTREQISDLLAKSESHASLAIALVDGELASLVAHLNALAANPKP